MLSFPRRLLVLALLTATVSCGGDSGTDPRDDTPTPGTLDFESDLVNLFRTRATSVNLVNGTSQQVGPIGFGVGATFDESGIDVRGVRGNALPPTVPEIRPGGEASVSVNLNDFGLPPGFYETVFEARIDGTVRASVRLRFEITQGTPSSAVSVEITEGPTRLVQGDPVDYVADPRNDRDEQLPPEFVEWFVLPTNAGLIRQDGRFVPYRTGPARIIARSGIRFDTLAVDIGARGATGTLAVVGTATDAGAEDVWVTGDHAYVAGTDGVFRTVDISDPANPTVTSEIALDAASVPSVHVRSDGTLAVAAHEGSSDGANGVTLFDLTDPAEPMVITRYTAGLGSGVLGVFLNGDVLHLARNGAGLVTVDVSDPADPGTIGSFTVPASSSTDVVVEDGIAFLSYFNSGSVVLDVGNGVRGGTAADPVEIGRLDPLAGQIERTVYWSERALAFMVEADDLSPGVLHVMDASDFSSTSAIASWATEDEPPSHAAVSTVDDRVFATFNSAGVRMLDASGTLEGDLEQQGREVAVSTYGAGTPDAVRVRTVGDLVFVADRSFGLVILRASD